MTAPTAPTPERAPGPEPEPELAIDVARVRRGLAIAVVAITVTGAIAHVVARGAGEGVRRSVTRPFLLDAELALPAWFASALLLTIAGVSWWMSNTDPDRRIRWRVLAAVFVALSLDEAIVLHELLDEMLADALGRDGDEPLWVFPAAVAVAGVGWYVLPLFRQQSAAVRRLWIGALVAFAGGAAVVEFVSRPYFDVPSQATLGYIALVTLEEGLEFVGSALFLVALLTAVAPRTQLVVRGQR